ncbi:MAG: flavodoxin family protein [Candidatus Electrothrix sp. AW2]|nr:flavodoxin family protein [Candidatus Electrothrix gigas]
MSKKIVILDGTRYEDKHLNVVLTLLINVIRRYYGDRIQIFKLREITINPCIGCFNCWIKTPGTCFHQDAVADILRAILSSHTVIFFTPVIFGGYSSELKKIIDRFLLITLPFLEKTFGEFHHPRRYTSFPHIVGIGTHLATNKKVTQCFKTLVGRNAINAHTTYRANVICPSDSQQKIQQQLVDLLQGTDKLPRFEELNKLMIENKPFSQKNKNIKPKALLIVGSQKTKAPSTSAVLGGCLLEKLKLFGMQTEHYSLKAHVLHSQKEQRTLCQAVDQAGVVIFSFPIYADSPPFLATSALEIIAHHKKHGEINKRSTLFTGISNSGLPESSQNIVALSICRNFALECGMIWAGGLIFGSGEMLISGNPLTGFRAFKGAKRPPLFYVAHALEIAASSLVQGSPIPEQAVQMLAKKPLPLFSVHFWHWFLMRKANRILIKEAKKNGITKEAMYSNPYESSPGKKEINEKRF